MNLLRYVFGNLCIFCGRTADPRDGEICRSCREEILRDNLEIPPGETGPVLSLYRYEGAPRNGLHRFKYRNARRLGRFCGRRMALRFRELGRRGDVVTCVPRAKDGLSRPYNQSAVLAKAFAKQTGLPFDPDLLRKRSGARTQVQCKSSAARRKNAAYAYRKGTSPRNLSGLTVILIDDLYTSGATARACEEILKKQGAAAVEICTAMIAADRPGIALRISSKRKHKQVLLRPDDAYRSRTFHVKNRRIGAIPQKKRTEDPI